MRAVLGFLIGSSIVTIVIGYSGTCGVLISMHVEEEGQKQWVNATVSKDGPDNDSFVIPSLEIEDSASSIAADPQPEPKITSPKAKKEENIYLGPHGAPPSQAKQQELNFTGRKQRFKQKLKEADKKIGGTGRENKLENLRELVGGRSEAVNMPKTSTRDWLDPHCHESQFERR